MKNKEKTKALLLVTWMYVVAFGLGFLLSYLLKDYVNIYLNLFLGTFLSTVIIFICNLVVKNASVYDPYWSVQPIYLMLAFHFIYWPTWDWSMLLIYIPLLIWAIRLTINWAIGFDNLAWEDWRYIKLKQENPKIAQFIVFTGIMLVPTIVVYAGTLPLFTTFDGTQINWIFALVGGLITLFGTLLETVADLQLKRYKKSNKGSLINVGLWKYSRHPNYLGEILVWVGVAVATIGVYQWYNFLGVLLVILLFIFISIPLAENRHLKKYPEYAMYKRRVSPLLILPNRKVKDEN